MNTIQDPKKKEVENQGITSEYVYKIKTISWIHKQFYLSDV